MDDDQKLVESYVRHYFDTFHGKRSLLYKQFKNDSEFSCEGKKYNGPFSILSALLALLRENVRHNITSINYRGLSKKSCLVYVCGKQNHSGVDSGLHFSQTLFLRSKDNSFYVYRASFSVNRNVQPQGAGN